MGLERYIDSIGSTVEQDAKSLITDVKSQFSTDQLKNMVTRSITQGIANCQLDRENKAEESKPKDGKTLAFRIRNLTKEIRGTLDCNSIQSKVKKELDKLKDEINFSNSGVKKKLEEIFPLIKVPLNPFKIPKYIVKQTIGRLVPDLKAALDMLKQIVELVSALSELSSAISEVLPRLEACATSTIDMVFSEIKHEIEKEINDLKKSITDAIAEAICNGLKDAKITQNDLKDAFEVIDNIKQLVDDVKTIKENVETTIGQVMNQTAQYSSDLQELTGLPSPFDTSNTHNFMISLGSTDYEKYIQDVINVYNSPEPVLVTIPTIAGTAKVGNLLTCSNGVWSANGVVTTNTFMYAFQWYRNGQEIFGANNFIYTPVIDDVETTLFCVVTAETQVTVETAQTAPTAMIAFGLSESNKPVVSGTPTVGSVLTSTTGTWPSNYGSFEYEWYRNDVTVIRTRSANNQYTVQAPDENANVDCRVYASSMRYNLYETSNNFPIMYPPVNTVAPVVSGTSTVGSTLSTTNGTWTSAVTPTYTYQWIRGILDIDGATSSTYILTSGDVGSDIYCAVTAHNIAGSVAQISSNHIGPIT